MPRGKYAYKKKTEGKVAYGDACGFYGVADIVDVSMLSTQYAMKDLRMVGVCSMHESAERMLDHHRQAR